MVLPAIAMREMPMTPDSQLTVACHTRTVNMESSNTYTDLST